VSKIVVGYVRNTSTPAGRNAQKATIPRCCNRNTCAFSGNFSTSSGKTDV
jgi:hypothetical protein